MKKTIFITLALIAVFFQSRIKADVVAPNYLKGNISASLELLLSLEKTVSKNESLLLWGGTGLTANLSQEPIHTVALGGELALEYRRYLSNGQYKKFFIGWYGGAGYMHDIGHNSEKDRQDHIILVFGCKLGCRLPLQKKQQPQGMCLEPYISAGITGYYIPAHISILNPEKGALLFNIGLRFVVKNIFKNK